ncbi:tRNA 5-carboxymethoxyuridine methyltransferase [Bacillus rhizoplanae]|uniref:tRNA 5-carboxymethoxyuridine methyltransferase n=1 Tax=Bacillus rhizoplanae TaxID=2880966 RepID=A0ABM8YH75_9BACI|nr:class I SAM-dependent methyltransferase [Bacillus rhizoplanae]CAG9615116.1 tRNA 5-carboxymethoxyuridine methyltransferase [Bacillus rhizoplanae]
MNMKNSLKTEVNKVVEYYSTFDEWGRLDREPLEFQVNWHYIQKYLPKTGKVLDNGAGPGKYAMKLAEQGYRVTLTDLVPRLVEVGENKARELGLSDRFDGFHIADARSLTLLENEQFDASLMMGPMYHLQSEQDRNLAIKELYRVTKNDGIVYVAFMPRIKHVLSSLLYPQTWKPNDNMDSIQQFIRTGEFNHSDKGRFTGAYYFNIEDIKPFMESYGFETLNLIGSSNIGTLLSKEQWEYWQNRGKDEFTQLIELLKETATNPHVLGVSSHLLYIGKKKR